MKINIFQIMCFCLFFIFTNSAYSIASKSYFKGEYESSTINYSVIGHFVEPDKKGDMENAINYFNWVVLRADRLTWEHLITIYEKFRGDERNPEYTDEIRKTRLRTVKNNGFSVSSGERSSFDILKYANYRDSNPRRVIELAGEIYAYIVENQILLDMSDLNDFDYSFEPISGIPGFNFSSTHKGEPPYDGHHRWSWFIMNYLFIKNGLPPFYFADNISNHGVKRGFISRTISQIESQMHEAAA